MPTAENVFPKVGNDPVYASEVNRFGGAGQFIRIGSFPTLASGTASQDFGSVVITGGSLSNPALFFINAYTRGKNARDGLNIIISGLSANASLDVLGSTIDTTIYRVEILAGSPFNGYMFGNTFDNPFSAYRSTEVSNIQWFGRTLTDFNTGSTTVLLFTTTASAVFSGINYSIQSFRGAI